MNRNTIISNGIVIISLLLLSSFAFAQILPEDPTKGGQFFASKGCVNCYAVKGEGGKIGPDLGTIDLGDTQLDLAAKIWNHTPSMIVGMEKAGISKPTLTGQEFTEISAYLYFLKFFDKPGNPAQGKSVFTEKGCLLCHPSSGKGKEGALGLNPTSAAGGTILIVLWTPSSKNPLFSIGGFQIRQNSD